MNFARIFDDSRFLCKGMIIVIAAGIILRVVLGYSFGYNNDVNAWAMTISSINGGAGLYDMAGYYYPPVWGYMLGFFGEIIEHLGIDSLGSHFTELIFMRNIEEEPLTPSPTFNLAISMFILIADLLSSFAIYWIIDHFTQDKVKAKIGFVLYFLGANVLVLSMMLEMFDSFVALMMLLCFILLIKGQDFLAGVMFCLAVMTKAFPGFLLFILIAYLIKKDREHCVKRIILAALGTIVALVILTLPEIISGNFLDIFSFFFARVDGSSQTSTIDKITSYGTLPVYICILLLEIALAVYFVKRETEDVDRSFLFFMLIASALIFINPGAPQYTLLMVPFLIIGFVMFDNRMKYALVTLIIGSIVAHMMHFSADMIAVTMFDGWIPFDVWKEIHEINVGPNLITYRALEWIGMVIQLLAVVLAEYYALDRLGIIDKIKKHIQSRKDGTKEESSDS